MAVAKSAKVAIPQTLPVSELQKLLNSAELAEVRARISEANARNAEAKVRKLKADKEIADFKP